MKNLIYYRKFLPVMKRLVELNTDAVGLSKKCKRDVEATSVELLVELTVTVTTSVQPLAAASAATVTDDEDTFTIHDVETRFGQPLAAASAATVTAKDVQTSAPASASAVMEDEGIGTSASHTVDGAVGLISATVDQEET